MKICFARHGESQANLLHEISNRGLRHGLTRKGREQAVMLAHRLQGLPITRIYSSPLLRAIETSVFLADRLDLDYEVVEALREYDCGILEGRSDEDSWQMWQELFDAWSKHKQWAKRIEGGESFHEVRSRFVSLIDDLIRPAYFTPETKRIGELFTEMQNKNYRMAVVVDEYGGTAGIVSLSRLVEEIIGPVGDEFTEADRDFEAINEYTFHVDGSMRIEEANEEMELELPEGEDYETVAGFILNLLGRIPKQGIQLRYTGLKIVITKMRGLKIEEVLIIKEKKQEHAPSEG